MAVAVIFLTRVPLPVRGTIDPADIAEASRHYPLVGAAVGALIGGCYAVGAALFPASLAATLAALAGAVITGAFHEDALGDVADGLGGGATVERKLEIMRDSRLGTYGVLALVGALLVRIQAIALFTPAQALAALIGVHAASRVGIVWLLWLAPRARTEGLGAGTEGLTAREPAIATAWGLAIASLALGGPAGALALVSCALAAAAVARLALRHVGGVTGDILGTTQQAGELAALLALAAWFSVDPSAWQAPWWPALGAAWGLP
jgi:adenosylcobinamide-GDP ribazoletransferase